MESYTLNEPTIDTKDISISNVDITSNIRKIPMTYKCRGSTSYCKEMSILHPI